MLTYFLIIIILFFIYIDIILYFKATRVTPKHITKTITHSEYKELIDQYSMHMIQNSTIKMIHSDDLSFIGQIKRIKKNISPARYSWKYNYPLAYLYIGLVQRYANDKNKLSIIDSLFIKDFVNTYKSKYTLEIGRYSIPYAAILLFEKNNNPIYKELIIDSYNFIEKNLDEEGLIHYFKTGFLSRHLYVDGLGMYIPFLVKYHKIFNCDKALKIAQKNFNYFITYGTNSYLPHYNINDKRPLGPNNWGRGIGWYILGLISLYETDLKYKIEARRLCKILMSLQLKPFEWAQFIGISNSFDSTATLPILILLKNTYPNYTKKNKDKIYQMLISKTTSKGSIYYASGDTQGIQRFNTLFGESEFSQGLLVYFLIDF